MKYNTLTVIKNTGLEELGVPAVLLERILKLKSPLPKSTNPISIEPHFMFLANLMSTPVNTVITENSEKRRVKMKIIEPKVETGAGGTE